MDAAVRCFPLGVLDGSNEPPRQPIGTRDTQEGAAQNNAAVPAIGDTGGRSCGCRSGTVASTPRGITVHCPRTPSTLAAAHLMGHKVSLLGLLRGLGRVREGSRGGGWMLKWHRSGGMPFASAIA